MSRLNKQQIEQQINEMYDSLAACNNNEDYDKAYKEAVKIENDLWSKLEKQEKLDQFSNEMYERLVHLYKVLKSASSLPQGFNKDACLFESGKIEELIKKISVK